MAIERHARMTSQAKSRVTCLFRPGSSMATGHWQRCCLRMQRALLPIVLFALTSCATAYTPPPLTLSHPAHLEAPTAAVVPMSTTLAYSSSDLPSPQAASAVAQNRSSASQAGETMVVGEGKVIATVPDSQQIVIDHKKIEGFMDAMTMGYRVDPPSLLEALNAGDSIRFTIDTQKNAIIKIENMNK